MGVLDPHVDRKARRPFVWGPVGGGESAPDEVVASLPDDGQRHERRRNVAGVGAHFTWDRLGDRLAGLEPYRSFAA